MRESNRLATLESLAALQRVRRSATEGEMLKARADEAKARDAEAEARSAADRAHGEWLEQLSQGIFSPELSVALAERLVERERQAQEAVARVRGAEARTALKESDWRLNDARCRAGDENLRRLRRRTARRLDEARLAALADRITFLWSRS